MANEIKKYLDTTALGTLVDQIKAEDAKVLAAAKDYTDKASYDPAGSAATAEANAKTYADGKVNDLANGQVKLNKEAIEKLNGVDTVEGSVANSIKVAKEALQANIDGVDGKADKNAQDIAAINNVDTGILKQAKDYTDTEVGKVQSAVNALDAYVGDIPNGEDGNPVASSVIAYINSKTEGIATDAALGELQSRVSQAETDIDNIEKDYLKAADKTELNGLITDAQSAADAAQSHSEGVAGDLAKETKAREDADAAQVERIATLEGQITGLSGAMHFKGVVNELPTDVSAYANGDVIVVGEKEYVFNNGAFVEFGDVSAEGERIAALEAHKTQYEPKVATLESEMDTAQADILLKAAQADLDAEVEARTNADTDLDNRLKVVEGKFEGDESVATQIATAKQQAIDAAATDATTKANTAESNAKGYTDTEIDKVEGTIATLQGVVDGKAAQSDLAALTTRVATAEGKVSTLETEMDAVEAKAHEHANATVLNGITAEKVTAWDAAEGNAKTYANGLHTAMTERVDALEENIHTHDNQDELDLIASGDVSKWNAATATINSFTPITSEEIQILFQ